MEDCCRKAKKELFNAYTKDTAKKISIFLVYTDGIKCDADHQSARSHTE